MQSSGAQSLQPKSLSDGVVRNASFTNRPPSPPYIHIPTPLGERNNGPLALTPSYASVDPSKLTPDDLQIITGGKSQQANDNHKHVWKYEDRRKAQPILDFLYLGPLSVTRNHEFLRQEGITMLLAVRDASMSHLRLLPVEKASAELNLQAEYVDVASRTQLIHDLPLIIAKVNDHLLRVYKSQLQAVNDAGNVAIDTSTFRRGKVLVFCETGNERSAVVVAAYMMAIYETDMVNTVQFISAQRFCVTFDEEMKHLLRSFGDILEAQRMVATGNLRAADQQTTVSPPVFGGAAAPIKASKKRGIEDTMDEEDYQGDFSMDLDRYEDRAVFTPYRQS
ncbi:hypothetical protein N8I77_000894 [Diaporthe amygdali]|uniref:Tyrosine specific protein phosphatases domain-containing protein n=1 Tax=Phomopsis amygdali TaxID=1214568 RepID=A0AAD9SQR2_PHOAM|nr:hypothetical protein N8I77_000894 [Diaporthe amygdali]